MEKYYIWLILAFGEGEPEISRLIREFGTAEKAYDAFRKNMALVGPELIGRAEKTSLEKAEQTLDSIVSEDISVITWESPDYPAHLRRLADPPCVLFAMGDPSLLRKKLLTVVGSRSITPATEKAIPQIFDRMSGEYAVAGTLSEGCDQLACLNALRVGIPFIEIMPCGFSHTYPAGSRSLRKFLLANGGLLLSEYLPSVKAGQGTFHRRSRILGGISYVTIVLQAGSKSGALLTAEYSYAPLFLPPNDIFSKSYSGAVNGVRNGGKLYLGEKSIEKAFVRALRKEAESDAPLGRLNFTRPKKEAEKKQDNAYPKPMQTPEEDEEEPETKTDPPAAADGNDAKAAPDTFETEEQRIIYELISASDAPIGTEELIAKSGMSADSIAEALLDLEMAGAVTVAGNRYSAS